VVPNVLHEAFDGIFNARLTKIQKKFSKILKKTLKCKKTWQE